MNAPENERTSIPEILLNATLEVWGQAGEQHLLPITGNSMLPFLREGDYVLLSHGRAGVRRGDLVVFRQGEGLVAHRVLRIVSGDDTTTFMTKGDHATRFDPPLNASEVLGRVLAIKRGRQYMRLDTTTWRMINWSIAILSWTWGAAYGRGWDLRRRFVESEPSRLTAFLSRSAWVPYRWLVKVIQILFSRWQG